MTRDYSRREFVAGCGCAGAGALLAGRTVAESGDDSQSETPPTRWTETYDGDGNAVTNAVVTAVDDDGFVFAGAKAGEEDDRVAWLTKTDAAGEVLWERTYSRQSTTVAHDLVAVEDGYALTGTTEGGPDGGSDGFAIRVDTEGSARWQQSFCIQPGTDDTSRGIVQREDGGFVCAGGTSRFNDGWIKRIGSDGTVGAGHTFDGGDEGEFYAVANHPDGHYLCAGAGTQVDEDLQGWITLVDDDGEQVWASSNYFRRRTGDATDKYTDYNAFYDVVEVNQGYLLAGATAEERNNGVRKGWVKHTNYSGGHQWGEVIDSDRFTELYGIASTGLKHYVVGETATNADGIDSKGYATNIDLAGNVLWSSTYTADAVSDLRGATLADDGGLVCGGSTASTASANANSWGIKIGGEAVETPTPTPTATPTPSPTPTPSSTPTVSPSPRPPDTPTSTATSTASPTSTSTATPSETPMATTSDPDEGSGVPLEAIGLGFVVVALGAGGFLYYRFVAGGEDGDDGGGDSGGTVGGPGPATGGSATLIDDESGDSSGDDDLTPASEVEADEEVTGAQTVVDKPDAGEDSTPDDASGEEAADAESDSTSGSDDGSDEAVADDSGTDEGGADAIADEGGADAEAGEEGTADDGTESADEASGENGEGEGAGDGVEGGDEDSETD